MAGQLGGWCASAGLGLALTLLACGSTRRSPVDATPGEGGAEAQPSGGTATGGYVAGTGGSFATGGASTVPSGEGGAALAGAGPDPTECIEGAPCTCGEATGTLACGDAEDSSRGQCVCPPEDACQAQRSSCFEPCGGDALGLWVLEEACFAGSDTGGDCAGGAITGSDAMSDLTLVVWEDEEVKLLGGEGLDVRAQVPLHCLGIESVKRCPDATFYASPLFFGTSTALSCEPSACGFCECSGSAYGGWGTGKPWKPGSTTLAFGAIEVPYCVDGDTLWAGGGEHGGERKAAYKFRRRSCVGKPLPCSERNDEQCGGGGDCQPGRCLPADADALDCAEQWGEESCSAATGCQWMPGGCWGTPSEACGYLDCEQTPGCSWGPPQARCGGNRVGCYGLPAPECNAPGCSMRTCDVPDGWGGVDGAPCERLTASACAKAAGCTLSGATCTGTTTCGVQTDAAVCALLECAVFETLTCGGYTTRPCSELSVEDCSSQPGCRLEW